MIKLPAGVEIHVGGQVYVGEIPDDLCPTAFLPATNIAAPAPGGKNAKPA